MHSSYSPLDVDQNRKVAMPKNTGTHHPIGTWKKYYMVAFFSLVAAMLFADQNLLAPHLTAAGHDFNFTDAERDAKLGGVIMGAFFAVGAPSALLLGWLGARYNRVYLLFAVVIFGEAPCMATAWVTQFWQLLLLRTLTGVSIGGALPLVYSLLGDLFFAQQRSYVSAVVQLSTGAGIAVGNVVAESTGRQDWRTPFLVVSTPTVLVACLMLLTTQDPPRGACEAALADLYKEGGSYEEVVDWSKVKQLLRSPSNILIIAQGLPGCLPWGLILTFMNDYLAQDRGLGIKAATMVLIAYGGGGAVGVVGGGALGQHLHNKWRKEALALLSGLGAISGIPPLVFMINGKLKALSHGVLLALAVLGGTLSGVPGPNLRAILMNVNEPEVRGVAFGAAVTDDLGKGLGPALVAVVINLVGRKAAFNIATLGWIPCGLLLCSLAFTMGKDEAAMEARLRASLARQAGSAGLDEGQARALLDGSVPSDREDPGEDSTLLPHPDAAGKGVSTTQHDSWGDSGGSKHIGPGSSQEERRSIQQKGKSSRQLGGNSVQRGASGQYLEASSTGAEPIWVTEHGTLPMQSMRVGHGTDNGVDKQEGQVLLRHQGFDLSHGQGHDRQHKHVLGSKANQPAVQAQQGDGFNQDRGHSGGHIDNNHHSITSPCARQHEAAGQQGERRLSIHPTDHQGVHAEGRGGSEEGSEVV